MKQHVRIVTLSTAMIAFLAAYAASAGENGATETKEAAVEMPKPVKIWYAAPSGKEASAGTREAPWDLASAIGGKHKDVAPGDAIYLMEGTYKADAAGQALRVSGAEGKPVVIRSEPGKRATVDGAIAILEKNQSVHDVWLYDIEVMMSRAPTAANDGGVFLYGGKNVKLINLDIHGTGNAVGAWVDAIDTEIYGCLIWGNGFVSAGKGHTGHCVYTQNNEGMKTISNCIMSNKDAGNQFTVHAWGSRKAFVKNFRIHDNIFFDGKFVVSWGWPPVNVETTRNYFYNIEARYGYGQSECKDCSFTNNVLLNGSLNVEFKNATVKDNLVVKSDAPPKDEAAKAVVLPNKYDPKRAHMAIYNWKKAETVEAGFSPFLKEGDSFRMMDPKDLYGKPLFEGKAGKDGKTAVPVKGEFGAFVVFKKS
jgi:hypothetical protein